MDEIVVGLDLSVSAQAALAWAAAQGKMTGHRVRAIHALALPATYTVAGGGYIPPVPFEGIDDSYRAAVKAVFEAVQPEPHWELQFMSNGPGPVLVAESRKASMLVLGTREHTGWGRLRTGSVSHYCLSHAQCPVVAVPVERLASGTAATGPSVSADHSQHSASPVV